MLVNEGRGLAAAGGSRATPSTPTILGGGAEGPFSEIRLAAALVDVVAYKVRAVTLAASQVLRRSARDIVGRSIWEFIDPGERPGAKAAMEALRAGSIDFYRAHRAVLGGNVEQRPVCAWVRAVDLAGERVAFVAWVDRNASGEELQPGIRNLLSRTIAIGLADRSCRVRYASVEPDALPGFGPDDVDRLLGSRLADLSRRETMASIAAAESTAHGGLSFAFPTSVTTARGESVVVTCVVTTLAGSPDRLFMLVRPEEPATGRERVLEGHLWRIAGEIEASGILLGLGAQGVLALSQMPEARGLTPRQWEILRRVAAGERVPSIAADLFLSQSTVRGHLTAIFDRFGVHSQAELLAHLAGTSAASG